jgi:hypothetical protein
MIFMLVAFSGLLTSTYGFHERNCGDVNKATTCSSGKLTASGEVFLTDKPTAAIPYLNGKFKANGAWFRLASDAVGTACKYIHINDKMNKRFHGKKYMDVSPAAQELLTGKKARSTWSGRVIGLYYATFRYRVIRCRGGSPRGD